MGQSETSLLLSFGFGRPTLLPLTLFFWLASCGLAKRDILGFVKRSEPHQNLEDSWSPSSETDGCCLEPLVTPWGRIGEGDVWLTSRTPSLTW